MTVERAARAFALPTNPRLMAPLAGLALALFLSGCGSSKPKPAPLEDLKPTARLSVIWSQRIGSVDGHASLALSKGTVTTAASDGEIVQFDLVTGRTNWRATARDALTASVGSDGRFAAVVTDKNELLTFDQGKLVWRERLAGRVITPPLVAGERIFVQAIDRSVRGYDAQDGRWLWQYQRPGGEPLALATVGALSAFRDTLLVGQGARLVGLDPVKGSVRFDVNIGTPRGTNEVERLADLVGPIARNDDEACVRAFQLSVACLELNRGSLRWSRPQAGTQGVAASDQVVAGADGADRLTAWNAANGDLLWRVDRFTNRGLSTPVILGDRLAVADRDGFVHLLALRDGHTLARLELDSALAGAPVVAGDMLLALTRKGTVYALRAN